MRSNLSGPPTVCKSIARVGAFETLDVDTTFDGSIIAFGVEKEFFAWFPYLFSRLFWLPAIRISLSIHHITQRAIHIGTVHNVMARSCVSIFRWAGAWLRAYLLWCHGSRYRRAGAFVCGRDIVTVSRCKSQLVAIVGGRFLAKLGCFGDQASPIYNRVGCSCW